MALATYSDLLSAVASWMERSDLSSQIPDFVTLFEAKMNRILRVRQMETSSTLTPSSGVATLPTDYLEHRRVTWNGTQKRDLEYVEPSYFALAYPTSPSDVPRIFTIEGTSLKVMPVSDTTVVLAYYAKLAALSATSTNWLMTAHPDAYLFGTLLEGYAFAGEATKASLWGQRLEDTLAMITRLDLQSKAPSAIRAWGYTP
jgi:hypothetical protein